MGTARIFCAAAAVLLCTARTASCLVDINTATAIELESLPGIGPVLARRIIESRPYESIEELTRVKGIGPKSFARLKNQITVGELFPARKQPPAAEEKGDGASVPMYRVDTYMELTCYRCKNKFKVSGELKTGWCPYCGTRLAVR
jgi:competence ComEA-like helix-hairpin-helix protein